MREKFQVLVLSLVVLMVIIPSVLAPENREIQEDIIPTSAVISQNGTYEEIPPVIEEPTSPTYSEDIQLIALIVMAEAENQPIEGKQLVIDTILNRKDHDRFPDTIHDVIYQKSQFTSIWNGRVDRCYVTDENCRLVAEELVFRKNYDVIFFNSGDYSKYGVPLFKVGDHYFSSY